jgi:hypothetical protein
MRVYSRAMGGGSWASVEDYLPAGNALGYNQNWQYRHTGGELLMMGATGEPSGYYPTDSNGLAVQSELPVSLAGSEIPTDAGDTWVGLMGFGNLGKCSPLELTYQKEGQLYCAYLELKPGAFYILWGDRLLIEEISSRETIPLAPAR